MVVFSLKSEIFIINRVSYELIVYIAAYIYIISSLKIIKLLITTSLLYTTTTTTNLLYSWLIVVFLPLFVFHSYADSNKVYIIHTYTHTHTHHLT